MVLETTDSQIFIGRFDRQDEGGVHMIGVSIYDPYSNGSSTEFVARTAEFGVRVDRPHLVIPAALVREIAPLGSIDTA